MEQHPWVTLRGRAGPTPHPPEHTGAHPGSRTPVLVAGGPNTVSPGHPDHTVPAARCPCSPRSVRKSHAGASDPVSIHPRGSPHAEKISFEPRKSLSQALHPSSSCKRFHPRDFLGCCKSKRGGFGVSPMMVFFAEHHRYPLPQAEAPSLPHPLMGQDGRWMGTGVCKGETIGWGGGFWGPRRENWGAQPRNWGGLHPPANHPCWVTQTGWINWGKQQGLCNFKK